MDTCSRYKKRRNKQYTRNNKHVNQDVTKKVVINCFIILTHLIFTCYHRHHTTPTTTTQLTTINQSTHAPRPKKQPNKQTNSTTSQPSFLFVLVFVCCCTPNLCRTLPLSSHFLILLVDDRR